MRELFLNAWHAAVKMEIKLLDLFQTYLRGKITLNIPYEKIISTTLYQVKFFYSTATDQVANSESGCTVINVTRLMIDSSVNASQPRWNVGNVRCPQNPD